MMDKYFTAYFDTLQEVRDYLNKSPRVSIVGFDNKGVALFSIDQNDERSVANPLNSSTVDGSMVSESEIERMAEDINAMLDDLELSYEPDETSQTNGIIRENQLTIARRIAQKYFAGYKAANPLEFAKWAMQYFLPSESGKYYNQHDLLCERPHTLEELYAEFLKDKAALNQNT